MPTSSMSRAAARLRARSRRPIRSAVEALESRTLLAVVPVAPSGSEFQVNSAAAGGKEWPTLALDGSGNSVFVWKSLGQDGAMGGIYGQRYDAAGSPQGGEFRVNTYTTDDQTTPSVATDLVGNFLVVWASNGQDGSEWGIYGQRYNAAGQPQGAEFQVNVAAAGSQTTPDVAADASGNFIVTWRGLDGIWVRKFDGTGSPVAGESRVNDVADSTFRYPRVAAGPGGSFVVAWPKPTSAAPSSSGQVLVQRFDTTGAKAGGAIVVDDVSDRSPYAADVGIDAAGNFVVAWDTRAMANTGTQPKHVNVRRYSAAGAALGERVTVATPLPAGETQPVQISVRPSGEFVVGYDANLGSPNIARVLTRSFAADGTPAGAGLLVNRNLGLQSAPAVAAGADGRFVVSWVAGNARVAALRYLPVINPATASGIVWNDQNVNGVHDAGEPGMDGVVVSAFTPSGAQAAGTTTSDDGRYRFDNLRGGDPYAVHVTAPPGTPLVVADVAHDGIDSDFGPDGLTPVFTPAAGQDDLAFDAGLLPPGLIGGFAWDDTNANGVRDAGESGRPNVSVDLYDVDGQRFRSAVTAADGSYQFASVPAGVYQLAFSRSVQFLTVRDQGADDALDSDPDSVWGRTEYFLLRPAATDRTWSAGYGQRTAVNGVAFEDLGGDGARGAADQPLVGWTVFADANHNGTLDPGEASSLTDALGNYVLHVTPGTHRIATALPPGWQLVTPAAARTVTAAPGNPTGNTQLAHVPAGPVRHTTPLGVQSRVDSGNYATRPAVATDAQGNSVVVWIGGATTSGTGNVYARRYDAAGLPLGDSFIVGADVPLIHFPSVGMEPGETFVVAWPEPGRIVARRYGATGTPLGQPFQVSQAPGDKFRPRVAIDPTGGFAVGWVGATSDDTGAAVARRFDAAGTPRGNEFRVNEAPTSNLNEAVTGLTFDAEGGLTVLWTPYRTQGGGPAGVFARRFGADGVPAGASIRVSAPGAGRKEAGSVAVASNGDWLAVWQVDGDVFGRLYDAAGTPRTAEFRVATSWPTQTQPAVAVGDGGHFLVTWTDIAPAPNPNGGEIRGRIVNPFGIPVGGEFRVNTAVAGGQELPAVAVGAGNTFVVAWSDWQIHTQRVETFADAASLSGRVWADTDGDGIQDPGESGVDGATVEVYTAAGAIFDTVVTGGGGLYRARALKPAESYRAKFLLPSGMFLSPPDQGGDDSRDSDADADAGYTAPFTAAAAGTVLDAGMVRSASVGGTAYHDLDGDGSRDPLEPALAGWTIFLDADADGQLDSDETSTTTSETGSYAFAPLRPATYQVTLLPYTHWRQSTPAAALSKTLAIGQTVTDADIGATPTVPSDTRSQAEGREFLVNATTAGNQFGSDTGSDAAGNFVTVWVNGSEVFARRYDSAGEPLGAELRVGVGLNPSVAVADGGSFVVAWNVGGDVLARRYDATGNAAGDAFPVSPTLTHNHMSPDVAAADDGSFVVVWQRGSQGADGIDVYARLYDAAGSAQGAEFRVNSGVPGDQTRPAVATDADGDFAVTFLSSLPNGNVHVWARRFAATGAPAGSDFRVNPEPAGTHYEYPDIAMSAAGDFVIVYGGFDGSGRGIEARRYSPQGVPQGGSFVANPSTGDWQEVPSVAMADDASFVVAWRSGTDIYGQLYNGAGLRLGAQFRANTTTVDYQYDQAVTMQPGGFVVTWTSQRQDGEGEGVYGQRFETFNRAASAGGVVFVDADDDGVRSAGEAGRAGVSVRLLDERDVVLAVVSTSADGSYRFNDLRPGAPYRLEFRRDAGFTFAHANAGPDDTVDSDVDPASGRTAPVILVADVVDLTWSAGLVATASVAGATYHDADGSGIRDVGEQPLAGRTVFLDADGNGRLDAGEPSAITTASGAYSFQNLRPGPYRVTVASQLRWEPIVPAGGSSLMTLLPGENKIVDFGSRSTAAPTTVRPSGPAVSAQPATPWPLPWVDRRWDYFAADSSGGFVVIGDVYTSGPSEYDVTARRYDASGSPLGPVFVVNTTTAGTQLSGAVAVARDGRFVVAWQGQPQGGGNVDVYAQRFDATGQKVGPEFRVNTSTAGEQHQPAVAIDAQGDFVIVWLGPDGQGSGVYAQRYSWHGGALGGEVRVNADVAGNQSEIDVASDAQGNFVVIWSLQPSNDSWNYDLRAQLFASDGTRRGGEIIVSDTGERASVAMNAAGEFAVVWNGATTSGGQLSAARFDANGMRQGAELQVIPPVTNARFPQVAVGDDGGVVLVWRDNDGSDTGIFSRRYDGSGLPIGEVTRLNPDISGSQSDPMVTALPNGGFVLAYHHHGLETRVQRFDGSGQRGVLGGVVWTDTDADGVRDAGESGAAGVAVELLNEDGGLAQTTATAADGSYRFHVVPSARYVLRFAIPIGNAPTLQDQGTDDAADSDVEPLTARVAVYSLPAGQSDLTHGLGLAAPASITGTLFNDRSGDGSRQAGEDGLGGWTVFLDANGDGFPNGAEFVGVTGDNGTFSLSGLPPGTHRLRAVAQTKWRRTTGTTALDVTLGGGQSFVAAVGYQTDVLDSRASANGPRIEVKPALAEALGEVKVGTSAGGDFVAVWHANDESGTGVFARRFNAAGAPLGPEFRVNEFTAGHQLSANVAVDDDGDFVVVWQSEGNAGGSGPDVYARRYDADGNARGGEFRVNLDAAGSQTFPDVAADAAGDFVVTWKHWTAGLPTDLHFQRFAADGDRLVEEVTANSTWWVQYNSVAMNASGAFVVVWESSDGLNREIAAQRFDAAGQKVGEQFRVNTLTRDDQMKPDVAVSGDGGFVVVWFSRDGGHFISMQRYDADGVPQGAESHIGPGLQHQKPQVATGGDGSFAVTWHEYDGQDHVFVRRFDAAGIPDGPPQRVSPGTPGNQALPAVAMDRRGDFVVAWDDSPAFGVSGVAAQRYLLDLAPAPHGIQNVAVPADTSHSLVDLSAAFTDDKTVDGELVFSVTGNTNPLLVSSAAIDAGAGMLKLDFAPSVTGSSVLTVRATDGVGLYTETRFVVRVGPPLPPPTVTNLFVNSTAWPASFRQAMAAAGQGDVSYGFRVPKGEIRDLPWSSLDQISMRFSADVTLDEAALAIAGVARDYDVARFDYDAATRTATWTLTSPLVTDSVTLAVTPAGAAGVQVAGARVGTANSGVRVNVLVGDVNRDGRVNAIDLVQVRMKLLSNTVHRGVGQRRYEAFADVTGDGRIDTGDLAVVRANVGKTLRLPAPRLAGTSATTAADTRSRPSVRRELFSLEPISLLS